jgi:hypothetical protein
MKSVLLLLTIQFSVFYHIIQAQTELPLFLKGTWKMEHTTNFEHWDILNDNMMKGFSYQIIEGQITVSEYVEINKFKNKINYTASVIQQNDGKSVKFLLVKSDSSFIFENQKHDFPKIISYQRISDSKIGVQISDGANKSIEYNLIKQVEQKEIVDSTN